MQPHLPDHLVDHPFAGRYRLNEPLARGGMATVWRATDLVLNRQVAVKILADHLAADPVFVQRFQREAQAAARLNHHGIVSIYDSRTDGGVSAIVMQYIDGNTLRDELDRKALDVHQVLGIGAQVAEALQAAHDAGIVHRDVKPANILLCRPDTTNEMQGDVPRVCVTDFGIAKALTDDGAPDLTATGSMLGTAKYLAPEQIQGGRIDARTDVYALGVVLYEAVCGRPPFVAEGDLATAMARLQADPIPPRRIRSDISRDLEAVILRALARHPDQRFASAAQFRAALLGVDPGPATPMAEHTTTRRGPTSFVESERSWMVPSLLVVAVALALVAGGVVVGRSGPGRDLVDRAIGAVGGDRTTTSTTSPNAPADAQPVAVAAATFDPLPGDGEENDDLLARLIDGDTGGEPWRTQCYPNGLDGAGKAGVGISLTTAEPIELARLMIFSVSGGWSGSVYLAEDAVAPETLAAWGEPVDEIDDADTTATIDLRGRRTSSVLLWFRSMSGVPRDGCFGQVPDSQRIEIAELALVGT